MTECLDQVQINFSRRLGPWHAKGARKVLGKYVSLKCPNCDHSIVHAPYFWLITSRSWETKDKRQYSVCEPQGVIDGVWHLTPGVKLQNANRKFRCVHSHKAQNQTYSNPHPTNKPFIQSTKSVTAQVLKVLKYFLKQKLMAISNSEAKSFNPMTSLTHIPLFNLQDIKYIKRKLYLLQKSCTMEEMAACAFPGQDKINCTLPIRPPF